MAEAISKWRKKVKHAIKNFSVDYMSSEYCFRDPIRPIKNNPEIIYSPADGIIIDVSRLNSVNHSIYTKMGHVCLSSLSHDMIEEGQYICITIFLTFYDPHIIRMPINGIVSRKDLPPLYVQDLPMLDFEETVLNNKISEINRREVSCFAFNQRTLFEIFEPLFGKKLYLLLTADYDIDTILSFFSGNNRPVKQNHRIAQIRYGSMATLIIPSDMNFSPCVKDLVHVEAGIDPILMYNEQ